MTDKGKVCVVGTGHIGLPLAAVLAEAGFEVTGYDTNDDFVSRVNTTGAADFREDGLDELLERHLHKSLTLTSSPPTICGRDSISGIALPSMVRSGQKARPNRLALRRISGRTTLRVVPMLTVLRRMMSGFGPNPEAIRWTAIRMRSRPGRWVPGSSGVPTVMM